MADAEKKKDKKLKDSGSKSTKSAEKAATPEKSSKDKKKESSKDKSKDKKGSDATEAHAAQESHDDAVDKSAHKSKSKSKKAEKQEVEEHVEKHVEEDTETKKDKKDKKKDKKKEAATEIEEAAASKDSAEKAESTKEVHKDEGEPKSAKKKSKEHVEESAQTATETATASGDGSGAHTEDHTEAKTEETPKKSKKSKKDTEKGTTESATEASSPVAGSSAEEHKDDDQKSKVSKKGKEKEEDEPVDGEPDIDLANLRTDQEKTVEELLDEGWVMAPTERPKAKPERPLPRVPGQGLDEKSSGVWASMSRPDFKALGLLPDDDEPSPQPVEEETPKEVPFSFEGTAVAEKYDVGPEVARTGSSRTHTAKAKEGGKDVFVIVHSKTISPVYSKRTCRAAEKALAALPADASHVQTPIESFVGKEHSFFVVGTNEGDLPTIVKTKMGDSYTEKHAALAVKQMLQAVHACHSSNVLHRDATVFSLFVRSFGADSIEVELGNFMSALRIRDPAKLPTDEPNCSDLFKSPEIMAGDAHGFPSDMWAVGCTAYFLLCGHAPFSAEKNRLRRRMSIKTANVPIIESEWKNCSEHSRDFVKKLLTKAPDRLTAQQALEHPWIVNLGSATPLPEVPQNITL